MRTVYPAPPGVREDIHARFLAVIERATVATALSQEVLAETPDDEEDDLELGAPTAGDAEDLGAGQTGGYREGEESAWNG